MTKHGIYQNGSEIDFAEFRKIYDGEEKHEALTPILKNINSIRDLIKLTGMSQAVFATRYKIPLSTLKKWATEDRKPSEWAQLMLTFTVLVDFGYLQDLEIK